MEKNKLEKIAIFGQWNDRHTAFEFTICPTDKLNSELKRCRDPILSPKLCHSLLESEQRCKKFETCRACIRDYYGLKT